LARACADGSPDALAIFDQKILSAVPLFVARFHGGPAFTDEVKQILREKLFVCRDGAPKIREYEGRGALRSWIRVAAVRVAVDLLRERGQAPPDDRTAAAAIDAAP